MDVGPVESVLHLGGGFFVLALFGIVVLVIVLLLMRSRCSWLCRCRRCSIIFEIPGWEALHVKDPSFTDFAAVAAVHDKDDAPGGAGVELVGDCGDGVVDPGADGGVAGLVHGEVEGAGGEERCWWVEVAVVEQRVDGDGEERGEGGEEGRCGEEGQ